mgnify:FL=1
MHTFAQLARQLKRSTVELAGLQSRFDLPILSGSTYSAAYLSFLGKLIHLRSLHVAEEALRDLWTMEKKLLHILRVDSTGSPTWFLDACGATDHPEQRLLLTNHNLGLPVDGDALQPGLDFLPNQPPELFAVEVMGEDALKLLAEYRRLFDPIRRSIRERLEELTGALAWARKRFR